MTEMEFLEKQEKHIKNCIDVYTNCLKIFNGELAVVQKMINQISGQPNGTGCQAGQDCDR